LLEKPPKVSFVIPVLNRERTIRSCIESITKQRYENKETIVVDGGSKDRTVEIALKYATKIIVDRGSLGQARKRGIDESSGEVLGIFDSDIIIPSQDWLDKAVHALFQKPNTGILWPIQVPPRNASLIARCYFAFWKERLNKTKDAIPGGNSLVLRKAYEDAGGFDSSINFGEDFDLVKRILEKDYTVVIFPYPIIHDTMSSLKEFTRKQMWGASSLLGREQDRTNLNLLSMCMTWKRNGKNQSERSMIGRAISDHVVMGFRAMFGGFFHEKENSLLLLPLLLGIRINIYSTFFICRKLF